MPESKILNTTTSGTTAVSVWLKHGGGPLSLQLITTGTLAGAWSLKASNEPRADELGDSEASDITAGFKTPADAAIADAAGSATSQFVQTTYLKAGAVLVTFTPTSGAGSVRIKVSN